MVLVLMTHTQNAQVPLSSSLSATEIWLQRFIIDNVHVHKNILESVNDLNKIKNEMQL